MIYTIRDNEGNIVCSVENTTTIEPTVSYESINAELKDLNEYGNKLDKSIEAFNLVSDTRAMEALGYVKGAGFSNNVKAVGNAIWEKIKEWFKRIKQVFINLGKWIIEQFNKIKSHFDEKKIQSSIKLLSDACNGSKTVEEVTDKIVDRSILMLEDNREETAKYNNNKEYEQAALAKYEALKKKAEQEKRTFNTLFDKLLTNSDFIKWMSYRSERESLKGKTLLPKWERMDEKKLNYSDSNFANELDLYDVSKTIENLSEYIENSNKNEYHNDTVLNEINKGFEIITKKIDKYNKIKNKSSMSNDVLIYNLHLILDNDMYAISNFKLYSENVNNTLTYAADLSNNCINLVDDLKNKNEINIDKNLILNVINALQAYLQIYITTVTAEIHSLSMVMPVIASVMKISDLFY